MIVSIIVVIILILSFFGGIKQGVVKGIFNLLALLIAIPLTGLNYRFVADFLSFLPGVNWENFIAFYFVFAIMLLILNLIFWLPRRALQKLWGKGFLSGVIGGGLNVLSAAISMVLFTLVVFAHPIFNWLAQALADSDMLMGMVGVLGFIQSMLPDIFQSVAVFFMGK